MIPRVIASTFAGTLAGAVLTTVALGALALSAHAASKPDPCKLLKTSEISEQFGGATASPGTKSLTTAVSVGCRFDVAATGDQPDGNIDVRVMTTGAKAAYNGLKKLAGGDYVPVAGVANSLWSEKTKSLSVLKGTELVTVQALFTSINPLPVHQLDTRAQAIALSKLAVKRA